MNEQSITYIIGVILVAWILYYTWFYLVLFLAVVGAFYLWQLKK